MSHSARILLLLLLLSVALVAGGCGKRLPRGLQLPDGAELVGIVETRSIAQAAQGQPGSERVTTEYYFDCPSGWEAVRKDFTSQLQVQGFQDLMAAYGNPPGGAAASAGGEAAELGLSDLQQQALEGMGGDVNSTGGNDSFGTAMFINPNDRKAGSVVLMAYPEYPGKDKAGDYNDAQFSLRFTGAF